jgi:hypothetical protein
MAFLAAVELKVDGFTQQPSVGSVGDSDDLVLPYQKNFKG